MQEHLISIILMFTLTALALVLGFVALLKQKSYLDKSGRTVTSIEVPFFGKMKTNFPALAFLFVGGALGYFSIDTSEKIYTSKEHWTDTRVVTIDGQLKGVNGTDTPDWSTTDIAVIPSSLKEQLVSTNGHYTIEIEIPAWEDYTHYVAAINFQYEKLFGQIMPSHNNRNTKCDDTNKTFLSCAVVMHNP